MRITRIFIHNESGATLIEYGIIISLIAIAAIATLRGLGINISGLFTSINFS